MRHLDLEVKIVQLRRSVRSTSNVLDEHDSRLLSRYGSPNKEDSIESSYRRNGCGKEIAHFIHRAAHQIALGKQKLKIVLNCIDSPSPTENLELALSVVHATRGVKFRVEFVGFLNEDKTLGSQNVGSKSRVTEGMWKDEWLGGLELDDNYDGFVRPRDRRVIGEGDSGNLL
jgi:hypothetical protein